MANPAAKDGTPSERTAAAFKRLLNSSTQLNEVSDALGASVASIDETLKNLNLGITAKVKFFESSTEDGFAEQCLAYDKWNGRWGLVITSVSGPDGAEEDDVTYNTWLFNDAPRGLRLRALDALPELLESLALATDETTQTIEAKSQHARELALAVKSLAPAKK